MPYEEDKIQGLEEEEEPKEKKKKKNNHFIIFFHYSKSLNSENDVTILSIISICGRFVNGKDHSHPETHNFSSRFGL